MQTAVVRALCNDRLFSDRIKSSCILNILRRGKKFKALKKANAKTGCEYALDHFDTFYRPMYGGLWPSIRISLLTTKKTCAVMNNYTTTEGVCSELRTFGAYNMVNAAEELTREADEQKIAANGVSTEYSFNTSGTESDKSKPSPITDNSHKPDETSKLNEQHDNKTVTDKDTETESDRFIKELSDRTSLDIFVPTEHVYSNRDVLQMDEVSKSVYTPADTKVTFTKRSKWLLSKQLQVMVCPPGNISRFPDPKGSLLTHYMMDAASVLPVIALDLQEDDHVLDLCAAPGGKTLTILQTQLPEKVVCNDTSKSRLTRLNNMLHYYLPTDALNTVEIRNKDGRELDNRVYDKVLVDVPCNTDRHALSEPENNLFNTKRLNERLELPGLQTDLLIAGIKSCAAGGSVVYSTCTLSFAQNDGVIQQVLDEIWRSTNIELVIEDLTPMMTLFKKTFKFYDGCRFGQLVIPSLSSNYGPMYFCKINRIK